MLLHGKSMSLGLGRALQCPHFPHAECPRSVGKHCGIPYRGSYYPLRVIFSCCTIHIEFGTCKCRSEHDAIAASYFYDKPICFIVPYPLNLKSLQIVRPYTVDSRPEGSPYMSMSHRDNLKSQAPIATYLSFMCKAAVAYCRMKLVASQDSP